MPSGASLDSASYNVTCREFLIGVVVVAAVASLPLSPLLWRAYWSAHPGAAPTATHALVDTPAMASILTPLNDGVHRLECAPHGRNPDLGWRCDVTLDGQAQPVRVEVNRFTTDADEALYHAGLRFRVDQGPSTSQDNRLSTVPSSLHVAVGVDPRVASMGATATTVEAVIQQAEQAVDAELRHRFQVQRDAAEAARQADEARKTPAQRAQENLDSWQRAAQAASATNGG